MRSILLLLVAACSVTQAAAPVSVEMRDGAFVVINWDAPSKLPAGGWASTFAVHAGDGNGPPILGKYTVESGALTFRPRFPLTAGLRIRATFRGKEYVFHTPRPVLEATTRVQHVYPTASTIPENQLKFYIEFTAPMSYAQAWRHIHLLKADGQPVELPFLEIDQQMWDSAGQRLTVLFDPGRIKRGVKPLEDIGPALEAEQTYTLLIDREWLDAGGVPLVESHRKVFKVSGPDRTPLDPNNWRMGTVKAGTRQPLVIDIPEPLDAALAKRLIWVDGVKGSVMLASEERQWRFAPDAPWPAGVRAVNVDTSLEDLAGNKVGRPFDVDIFEQVDRRVEAKVISLPLSIGR